MDSAGRCDVGADRVVGSVGRRPTWRARRSDSGAGCGGPGRGASGVRRWQRWRRWVERRGSAVRPQRWRRVGRAVGAVRLNDRIVVGAGGGGEGIWGQAGGDGGGLSGERAEPRSVHALATAARRLPVGRGPDIDWYLAGSFGLGGATGGAWPCGGAVGVGTADRPVS